VQQGSSQHHPGFEDEVVSEVAGPRRLSAVDFTPIVSKRFLMVPRLHLDPGKGLPSRAFGHFQRVVRATSAHGTYTKSVALGAALFQNRTAR
jgi:hypothetical protein